MARLRACMMYRVSVRMNRPVASAAAIPAQPAGREENVAAVTAQPLAALPPYGCGVPLAGNERPAGWQYLRHKFIGAMPSSLSLRGGRRPTWQSRSTRPDHRKAIGENATAFPRLHPKGTSSRFARRAPRRLAPNKDTSGGAAEHQRPPAVDLSRTWRSGSAAKFYYPAFRTRHSSKSATYQYQPSTSSGSHCVKYAISGIWPSAR